MNKEEYYEKLKDPRWQKKRLEIFKRDEFTCQICGDKESPLHVHHMCYNSCDPWDIHNKYLITLCENCHGVESVQKSEALNDIRLELSRNYHSDTLNSIAIGLINMPNIFRSQTYGKAIGYALQNKKILEYIFRQYINRER